MKTSIIFTTLAICTTGFLACKKDKEFKPDILPSEGTEQTLNGGEGGANAVNSVFVDFSSNGQDSVKRASWDLGFYSGNEFRVILNYTASAGAFVTTKTDLSQVGSADTAGLLLAVNQMDPQPSDLAYFDDASGNISGTVIPAVSSVEADNKVVILNRGMGGGIPARPWIKLRVLRNGANGYTLQFAELEDANFQTVNVIKDPEYNFVFVSLDNGSTVKVEPKKKDWDIQWTYSVFKTSFGAGDVPYNFSDLVAINHLGGVQAAELKTSTVSYADYNESHIAGTSFSSDRWVIGSNWRTTTGGATGVKTDRFYVVKDPAGNVYKLKFVSFHPNDGGLRGYPVIEYRLVKQG